MNDQLSNDLASLRINREEPGPGGGARWLRWVGVIVVIAGLVAAYRFLTPALSAQFFKTEIDVTEISTVSPAQAAVELTSTGYVVPQVVSMVGAQVPGRVARVLVKQGDQVQAGDVLLELDKADHEAGVRTARSQVAAAQARVQTAKANLAEAKLQAVRERRLVEAGVSPKANAENLEARAQALGEVVKAAAAEVVAQQAQVSALSVSLEQLVIKSPISGTVTNKPPEAGELVGALTLEPLAIEVTDFSSLLVETDVPEARLHLVKLGSPCEIVLDAYPNRRFRGKAKEITPKVNRQKATVQVKVAFIDATDGVLPEMAARVSFLTEELDEDSMGEAPKVVVPSSAVVEKNGTKVVYVVDGDQVRIATVALGEPFAGGFELKQGPPAGTRVVKAPPPGLGDGQRVKEREDG
jgi:RND family efflux transporter MFP subunit